MIGVNIGMKRPRMIADHGSWVACILAAQENRNKPDRFPGLAIKVSLESEHQGHNDDDVIDLGGDWRGDGRDKRVERAGEETGVSGDGAGDGSVAGNAGTGMVRGERMLGAMGFGRLGG